MIKICFHLICLDCLDHNYKTDEDRFQKVFVSLVLQFFISFIVNLNDVLEYLLKVINPKVSIFYFYLHLLLFLFFMMS